MACFVAAPKASSVTLYRTPIWSEGILADKERFVLELRQILAPYQDAAGLITFQAISWAVEYRRHE